jgi:small-conductance mechanosensitive channel
MSLLEFCRWIQYSAPLVEMRSSPWLFPAIATIHLFGLVVIGGAVLVGDLRLLGFGLRHQPVAHFARDAERWLLRGLFIAVPTGLLLFMCFATKYYYLTFFWVKLVALTLVIVFTFSVRRRVIMADQSRVSPVWNKLVALVSLSLWTVVALGGRWIGFP